MHVEILAFESTPRIPREHFPLRGTVRQRLKSQDFEDYRLVELSSPVTVDETTVRYVVLWPCSGCLDDEAANVPFTIGLDMVTDDTLALQDRINFGKCEPVGFARAVLLAARVAHA